MESGIEPPEDPDLGLCRRRLDPGRIFVGGFSSGASGASGFGGVLSFELRGGTEAAEALIAGVEIPLQAVSLGGIDTLI